MTTIKTFGERYAVYYSTTDEYGNDREYPYVVTEDDVEIDEFTTADEAMDAAREYAFEYRKEQIEEKTNDTRDETQDALLGLSNLIDDCSSLANLQEIKAALLALTARFQD